MSFLSDTRQSEKTISNGNNNRYNSPSNYIYDLNELNLSENSDIYIQTENDLYDSSSFSSPSHKHQINRNITSPSSPIPNDKTTNSSPNLSAQHLAIKLRKIKLNLEKFHLNSDKQNRKNIILDRPTSNYNEKYSLDKFTNQNSNTNFNHNCKNKNNHQIIPILTEYLSNLEFNKNSDRCAQFINDQLSNVNNIKKAIYSENLSRQSSIRPLLSSSEKNKKDENLIDKNKNSNLKPQKTIIDDSYGDYITSNFAKIRQTIANHNDKNIIPININRIFSEPLATRSETYLNIQLSQSTEDKKNKIQQNEYKIFKQKFIKDEEENSQSNPNSNNISDQNEETESILSDFKTNLNFDETKSSNFSFNSNNSNKKNNNKNTCVSPCFTNSDILSNASSIINNNNFIIREEFTNSRKYYRKENEINLQDSFCSNEKIINYHRLSNSINNLFSNLINHLEEQKNRDYIDELGIDGKTKINNHLNMCNLKNSELYENKNKIKNDSNKDSTKDSGFNQPDFFNNNETTFDIKNELQSSILERYLNNEQLITYKQALIDKLLFDNENTKQSILNTYDDFSINEYILNQEGISINTFKQLIKEKYPKFSWSDNLLNELFKTVNQNNETLNENIFYENCDTLSINERNTEDEKEDKEVEIHKNYDVVFQKKLIEEGIDFMSKVSDKKLSSLLKIPSHNFIIESLKNSPSTSTKSYRKIKDIKNATSLRKNRQICVNYVTKSEPTFSQLSSNLNSVNDYKNMIIQENLKKKLPNSFTKRQNRKGSLSEINANRKIDFESNCYNSNKDLKSSSFMSLKDINNIHDHEINDLIFKHQFNSENQRPSRQSAFILEVLRKSMFRSKSLSDFNNSLTRSPDPSLCLANFNQNKCDINKQIRSSTLNKFNIYRDNEYNQLSKLLSKYVSSDYMYMNNNNGDSLSQIRKIDEFSYNGIIWQCADMCYDEYKNKFKELYWLLNGDRISTNSKLKEVEQRLKIELNLKEKNINLFEDLRKTHEKQIQSRLLNQIKFLDQKIKELESMRLFLKICQINSHSLEKVTLDEFFGKSDYTQNTNNEEHQNYHLRSKSSNDLIKSLYGNEAIINGYVYQFFVVYRYIFSSAKLLLILKDNYLKAKSFANSNLKFNEVMNRTVDLLAMWIDGFYIIDFQQNQTLIEETEKFILNEIKYFDEKMSKVLIDLLHNPHLEFNLFISNKKFSKKLKNITNESGKKLKNGLLNKRIFNRTNLSSKKKNIDVAINTTTNTGSILNSSSFSLLDYSIELIGSQLTLLEWDNFMDVHVCHCLNSKAQGVNCDSKQPIDLDNISAEQSLFVENYLSKSVYKMIQYNFLISHWVSVEILLLDNIKLQASLITKFIRIAQFCYKSSNFSTAFSIYDGLQDITIKNLPVWQNIAAKTIQILDKIATYRVQFQNEPKIINEYSKTSNNPVIPYILYHLLIIQQNEHGSFKLKNGYWKWSKLESLANLVDQIRNIQQHFESSFEPCEEFVDELLRRMNYLKDFDLNHLAEYNRSTRWSWRTLKFF